MEKNKIKVGIVGAGVAGLSAAHLLEKKGFEVVVFEATDRIGGRVHELNGFSSKPIELGAEIIHGNKSKFFKLAKKAGAIINKLDDTIYMSYNDRFDDVEILYKQTKDYSFRLIWDIIDDLYEECENKYPDVTVRKYLEEKNIDEKLFFVADALLGTEYSTDIDKLSIRGVSQASKTWQAGENDYVIQNMSNMDVFRKLYASIIKKVKLEKEVIKLDYSSNKLILTDRSNQIHSFDHCIIAVPLNQIKKIEFHPPLPDKKAKILKNIEVNSLGKLEKHLIYFKTNLIFFRLTSLSFLPLIFPISKLIKLFLIFIIYLNIKIILFYIFTFSTIFLIGKLLLKFSKKFWPEKATYLIIPGLINIYWGSTRTSDPILTGFVGGTKCEEINRMFKEEKDKLIKIIISQLEKSLKTEVALLLEDAFWFNWGSEKFFEGGYSHPMVSERDQREILEEDIDEKVFFAGEGVSERHNSTVHGGLESGRKASKRIISLN